MNRFLSLSSAILFSILSVVSFGTSSASASSSYSWVHLTDKLEIVNADNNSDTRDVSTDYFGILKDLTHTACYGSQANTGSWRGSCAANAMLDELFDDDDSNWLVFTNGPAVVFLYSDSPVARLEFYKNQFNKDALRLVDSNNSIYVLAFTLQNEIQYMNQPRTSEGFHLQPYPHFESGSVGYSSYDIMSQPDNGSKKLFLSTFPVEYPEGYDGPVIPDTWGPGDTASVDPLIDWILTDKLEFSARYLDNIPDLVATEWTWKIYHASDDFEIDGEPIFTSPEIQNKNRFVYQFEEKGHYIARASFRVPAPGLPPPPEVRTTLDIQLDVNGYYQTGGTNRCENGVCEVPKINCMIQPTYLQRLTCQTEQMFNFGLINPSILAFKGMFTSFIVPATPACSVPLPNVPLAPGKVFSLTGYSSAICSRSAELRGQFPIMEATVNFVLAMMLLWMVVRIINRVTDNTKHDMIEGI